MSLRWKLFRLFNTNVYLHSSFLMFFGIMAVMTLISGGLIAGLLFLVKVTVLFSFIIMHEFGHIFAARKCGCETYDINIMFLGAAANMSMSRKHEAFIGFAGPLVNIVFIVFFLGWRVFLNSFPVALEVVNYLILINVMICMINFYPAFPLDGGRIIRGILSRFISYDKATDIVSYIAIAGVVVAWALVFTGVVSWYPALIITLVSLPISIAQLKNKKYIF